MTTTCGLSHPPTPVLKDNEGAQPAGWPGSREYRVSEAAGIGHPAGQGSGGVAVVVLVFAPISVVFAATALELREEASREGSCCDH